ncbi:hypothetical protein BMF94_4514 [Rhodotorula taiwanensis]|uniref:Protein CPL1-like domain-containing protein n=1 Tax=Rhodotorula taiwanensis TaxID=741276 RepID=A0A2S5B7F3_9BASI|nr:hypothetical protein BMF94_4514 [Rhodotorula taiwanensis]
MPGRILDLTSILTLASLAANGPAGYGRFPCTLINGDGTFSPDPNQCTAAKMIVPGTGTGGTGFKGDEPKPVTPVCTLEVASGLYYCGIDGAPCTLDDNCDVGNLGFLYCTDIFGAPTAADTCGGLGSFCQDPYTAVPGATDAEQYAIFNQFCESGYCSFGTGVCAEHVTTVGGDCSSDPLFACSQTAQGQPLLCDPATLTCQLVGPSARARHRRKRNVCPDAFTACPLDNRVGFECVDIQSNLEQCGACSVNGGTDCTALPGVEAVGCVAGRCEIWSCVDGHSYDPKLDECVKISSEADEQVAEPVATGRPTA